MKSLITASLFLTAFSASAITVETIPAQKSTATVNSSKIKVKISYKKTLSVCDDERLNIAINAVDYVDQSSSNTAAEKRTFVIETRTGRIGDLGCNSTAKKTITVSDEKVIDLSQGRHVNIVEIFHDAGQKIEIKEI